MTQLPDSDSLELLQSYIKQVGVERGFEGESLQVKMMLLSEELGELARAVRKHTGGKLSKDTHLAETEEEAADVLIVLLDICNKLGIDLSQSFTAKETKNQSRSWK